MSRDDTMNVTRHNQFKTGALPRELGDDKMQQIRELLFGEFERQNLAKQAELEARIKELELGVHQRLDALQARLDELSSSISANHRSAFEELAQGMSELSERIRKNPRV